MEIVNSIAHFITEHWMMMLGSFIVLWKGKELYLYFVLQPLRGGNGVVQMDEFIKYVLTGVFIYMAYKEGESAEQVYDTGIFIIVVIGMFLMAGVKEFATLLSAVVKKWMS